MRVPRQDERNVQGRRFLETPRVVCEQHDSRLCAADESRDIASAAGPVPQTHEVERVTAHTQGGTRITQHFVTVRDQRSRHVAVIVVVA